MDILHLLFKQKFQKKFVIFVMNQIAVSGGIF